MNSEETILIGVHDHESYQLIQHDNESVLNHEPVSFVEEFTIITKSSCLLAISFFLQYFISIMAVYSAGRLGPEQLAAVQLAVSTFNISGNAIYQGISTSLDSFCPQAFGKKKYHDVGLYFQKCTAIMLCVTAFLLSFVWWNSGLLLSYLIDNPDLIAGCQTYLRCMVVGAPGLLLFESSKRFLLSQQIVNPITYILLLTAPINLLANYLLVWHSHYSLGFIGIPISAVILYWCLTLFTFIYICFLDAKKCWNGIDLVASFTNWTPMLKLAIPGIVMVEAEYLAFQILNFFAATLGTIALAAQSICSAIGSLVFQIFFSISVLIGTRVGHLIGCQDFKGAQNVVKIAILLSAVLGVFVCVTICACRSFFAGLFTKDEELLKQACKLLLLLGINQVADAYNIIGAGVLRGQGRQRAASILNLISYYVVALPVGYYLAFYKGYQVFGLWCGLVLGVAALATAEMYYIVRSDWAQIAVELHEKINR